MLEEGQQVWVGQIVVDDEAGVHRHLRAIRSIRAYHGGIAVASDMIPSVEYQDIGVVSEGPCC